MANESDDTQKNQDEENFGLPEIEYKPLNQLEEKQTTEETSSSEETEHDQEETESHEEHEVVHEFEEEQPSKAPLVIGVIIALVVCVAGFMIYKFVYLPKKAKQEQLAKEKAAADQKAEADRKAKEAEDLRLKQEAEARAKANAKPAEGAIETLSQRTGRYFVVVSSSIDGDLAMDQAKKLSAKGISSKIIPPYGKWKYYRLGIGDFDSYASAQSSADASKSEYGNGLWVIKY